MHKLRAEVRAGGRGCVWLDDVPINVRELTIHASAGKITEATVTLACDVDVSGEMEIDLIAEMLRTGKINIIGVPARVRAREDSDDRG